MITRNKNELKYIIKGISIIFLYFFVSLFKDIPFILMHINTANLPSHISIMYNLAVEILMITVIFTIFDKEIKDAFNDIKKKHYTYFKDNLKYYIIGLIVMMASNMLINTSHVGPIFIKVPFKFSHSFVYSLSGSMMY